MPIDRPGGVEHFEFGHPPLILERILANIGRELQRRDAAVYPSHLWPADASRHRCRPVRDRPSEVCTHPHDRVRSVSPKEFRPSPDSQTGDAVKPRTQ